MTDKFSGKRGFSRRTVVKGAAWSVPVLATAVTVPMASASENPTGYDVGVAADCVGNYDLSKLLTAIKTAVNGITILGVPIGVVVGSLLNPIIDTLSTTVETLLGALGLTKFESRGFTVQAVEGTVPAGTLFTLSDGGFINLNLLPGILNTQANALGLVSINGGVASLALNRDLLQGETLHFSLQGDAVNLSVGGTVNFGLVGSDNPTTAPGAPNSTSQNFVVVETNLQQLGLVQGLLDAVSNIRGIGPVISRILSPLRTVLNGVAITLQLCPGQPRP